NAFKFSLPGTPVQIVSSMSKTEFHLFVIDQGQGLTQEQIASIGGYMQFQRQFYEQQGSGLGLSIAKRIIELQGGELAIESFPGKQTIVRISLPRISHLPSVEAEVEDAP
ncbi:MAG TPA: ATP-binding protein, partial [Allocoleopsis sp.]